MRPCPTCECFVPAAARRCPRCEVALEPIAIPQEVAADRDESRAPVLVGAGGLAAPLTGSGHAEPTGRSGATRLALAPRPECDGPRPATAVATDPLVLAVFLGIPGCDAAATPVEVAPTAPDRFAALLGTVPAPTPAPAAPSTPTSTPIPVPTPAPAPAPEPTLVAVPLSASSLADTVFGAPPRRVRLARRDPFARSATRRERVLTRLCTVLVLTLAIAVIVLRLPVGARPELGASSIANPPTTPVTASPFDDAIREQTRADLQVVISTAQRLYPIWRSYAPATATVLSRAMPQFGFVTRTQSSSRVGELSVATSAHGFALAEYAGPGRCAFARVVDRHAALAAGPMTAVCRAAALPKHGWTALS